MKHVRVTITAHGREDEIHPMYDVLANAPYVEYATAMHWNFTGEELGIMHYVEGDVEAYRRAAREAPEVIDFEVTRAGEDAFYVYVRDETNEPLRELFGAVTEGSVVTIPPIEYGADGRVTFSMVGPGEAIQAAIERVPDPVEVTVEEVGGLAAAPGVLDGLLTDRQRAAVEAALSLGYYEIPRTASQADVARELDCAESTAAEHLRKAEAKLVRSVLAE
ncbi:MAG: helix-turn-helix domain-containing protein [Haloarculaceae archaeon]